MKILFLSNIPSPYQIKWTNKVKEEHETCVLFVNDIENSLSERPSYWNIDLPKNCKILPSYFRKSEFCYCPSLKKEIGEFNPEIIFIGSAWYSISSYQAYRWAKRNNKKILMGPLEFGQDMFSIFKKIRNIFIYRYLYRGVNIFLANAFIHFDYLKFGLGIDNVEIFMNFDDYKPYLSHKIREKKEEVKFLYGGSIDRRMRVPELLDCFEKIVKIHKNTSLIIGGYGPEKELCIEKVSSSSLLCNKVEFWDVETWEEITNVFESCDVLINYASYSPGSGVILSSVASGMGIISTNSIQATRHFVIDGYNGFLVDSDSSLYDSINSYLIEGDLLETHSSINKDIGLKLLTFNSHLSELKRILNNI